MRNLILTFLVFLGCFTNAQNNTTSQTTYKTQIFSLSPIAKNVDKVNGLVVGVGHFDAYETSNKTINGINAEANPMALIIPFFVFYIPTLFQQNKTIIKREQQNTIIDFSGDKRFVKVNGINVSSGCFFYEAYVNGINISSMNKINTLNGFNYTVLGVQANKMNGFSVSLYNGFNNLKGISFGGFNEAYHMKGLQIGIYNFAVQQQGLQIGVFNFSKGKGLQIGLWNINNKRSLPFINW
jgi:hypothetical protein